MKTKKIKIKSKNKRKTTKEIEEDIKKNYGITARLEAGGRGARVDVNGYVKTKIEKGHKIYEVHLYTEGKDADFERYAKDGVLYTRGNKVNLRTAEGVSDL